MTSVECPACSSRVRPHLHGCVSGCCAAAASDQSRAGDRGLGSELAEIIGRARETYGLDRAGHRRSALSRRRSGGCNVRPYSAMVIIWMIGSI